MKKDKQKVIGETFNTEKLTAFLALTQADGTSDDFHILLKAYRGLPLEGFEAFLRLFIAQGRNLGAVNPENITFLDYISDNESQQEYAVLLKRLIDQSNAEKPET